jgi:hypothetical protein
MIEAQATANADLIIGHSPYLQRWGLSRLADGAANLSDATSPDNSRISTRMMVRFCHALPPAVILER